MKTDNDYVADRSYNKVFVFDETDHKGVHTSWEDHITRSHQGIEGVL